MCDRLPRRDFLRIGGLGLGGLTLADLFRAKEAAAATSGYLKNKSVVLLFLSGGPSQYETFDPKPGGTENHTSIAGHIATKIPGVRFSSYLPKLADRADKLTIVRSFQTNHSEHSGAQKQIMTADLTVGDGKPINEPGLGAVYARVAGPINPRNGMLRHAVIPPTLNYLPERSGFAGSHEAVLDGAESAWLGAASSPFSIQVPMGEGTEKPKKPKPGEEVDSSAALLENLQPHLNADNLADRVGLLREMDGFDRRIDATGTMDALDAYSRQALEVLRGNGVRRALDLSQEDPRTLAAYDTEHFRNWKADENFKFIRTGPSIGFSLGRQLLLARRMCEAGAGFVTVVCGNWDFHARKNIPNMPEGMDVFGPPLDHAVSAFLDDVEARGLSDDILLVITGEFGRTGLDANLGRHHHPGLCPLVFAGGGLRHGQVVGQSNERGSAPATEPITIADLHATVLHQLFDIGQMRVDDSLPKKLIERAERGRVIRELS